MTGDDNLDNNHVPSPLERLPTELILHILSYALPWSSIIRTPCRKLPAENRVREYCRDGKIVIYSPEYERNLKFSYAIALSSPVLARCVLTHLKDVAASERLEEVVPQPERYSNADEEARAEFGTSIHVLGALIGWNVQRSEKGVGSVEAALLERMPQDVKELRKLIAELWALDRLVIDYSEFGL